MSQIVNYRPTPEEQEVINSLVESGVYRNAEEVIKKGLSLIIEQSPNEKLRVLRQLADEGDKSEDSDLTLEQLRVKLDAKANASGW